MEGDGGGVNIIWGGEGICEVMGECICIMGGESWKVGGVSRNTGESLAGDEKRGLGAHPSNCEGEGSWTVGSTTIQSKITRRAREARENG